MSRFRVASRMLKETETEKCPRCLEGWSNFIILDETLWACFKCGSVFVPKSVRYKEQEGLKDQIEKQVAEVKEKEKEEFRCPQCDFVGKNVKSLDTHKRFKHKDE